MSEACTRIESVAIRFWLGVVQREHVLHGVAQGIAQFNHGSKAAVARLREADGLIYYSPRVSFPDGDPLREFTAIGRVADDVVFEATGGHQMTTAGGDTLRTWRRRIDYDREAQGGVDPPAARGARLHDIVAELGISASTGSHRAEPA